MKGTMPAGKSKLNAWLKPFDPIRQRVELFLAGRAPEDPLYLTNRSWQQKGKAAALIGGPVLALIALVSLAATDVFHFHKADPYEHPPAEAATAIVPQKRLPDPVLASADLEVVNIRISKDARPPMVSGLVRNNTGQKVDSAEVSYYLADTQGSLVGTDTADVANVGPHASVAFRMALKVANAQYVIVRDVHPN